jgi:hypothetical protein
LTDEQETAAEEAPTTPRKGSKSSKKGHTYQKGKSCIQLGQKHNYKITPSGKSMRCTKCGSTRWIGKPKKAKKGKKAAAESNGDNSQSESNGNQD